MRYKICGILIVLLIFLCISVSFFCGYVFKDTTINQNTKYKIYGESGGTKLEFYVFSNDNLSELEQLNYYYPSIELHGGSKKVEEDINEILQKSLIYYGIEPWESETFKYDNRTKTRNHFYELQYNSDKIISFASRFYWLDEGGNGYGTSLIGGITVDMTTGKEVYLDDIVDYDSGFFDDLGSKDLFDYSNFEYAGNYGYEFYHKVFEEDTSELKTLSNDELHEMFLYKYSKDKKTIHNYVILDDVLVVFIPTEFLDKKDSIFNYNDANSITIPYSNLKLYLKNDVWMIE